MKFLKRFLSWLNPPKIRIKYDKNLSLDVVMDKIKQHQEIKVYELPIGTKVVAETHDGIYSMVVINPELPPKVIFRGKAFPFVVLPLLLSNSKEDYKEDIIEVFSKPVEVYFLGSLISHKSSAIIRGVLAYDMCMEISTKVCNNNFSFRSTPIIRASIFGVGKSGEKFNYKMEWK